MTKPRPDNGNTPKDKPEGPRTPYPVDHPGVSQQPGVEPDYLPGKQPETLPKM